MRLKPLCCALVSFVSFAADLTAQNANQHAPQHLQLVDTLSSAVRQKAPSEKKMEGYLLVYFKDETHSLYFATSEDGYTFTDVNGGQPVLLGADVAEQKGIRDPYIMRGPDNSFYMAMTDLHVFGKQAGYRATQWQRPAEKYAWGNNRALVLMKSNDLLHWTHTDLRIDQLYPDLAEIGCAWAPEMIFDSNRKQLMIYFTTRQGAGPNYMVYAYTDPAFTTLVSDPKPLFTYPKPGINTIDGDITRVGSTYHLFYVAHDKPGNLRQAVSQQINGGYVFNPQKIDPETVGAEAPNLWRRNRTSTYVLMYDVFGAKPHNMGFSETTDLLHFRDLGRFNEPGSPMKTIGFERPKHGAVMSVTQVELRRIRDFFDTSTSSPMGTTKSNKPGL